LTHTFVHQNGFFSDNRGEAFLLPCINLSSKRIMNTMDRSDAPVAFSVGMSLHWPVVVPVSLPRLVDTDCARIVCKLTPCLAQTLERVNPSV